MAQWWCTCLESTNEEQGAQLSGGALPSQGFKLGVQGLARLIQDEGNYILGF